jgi:uncharacterized protein YijF (DUF1287 family)
MKERDMPHDPMVKDAIQLIVKKIALALNTGARYPDYAEIKSYNKLDVYEPEGYCFEVVVRLPMEPRELENHRLKKERMRVLKKKKIKEWKLKDQLGENS